jgi:hypothetical protein
MPRPRVRFTIRWLMVAVTIVGSVSATFVGLGKRADRFRALAKYHGEQVLDLETVADGRFRVVGHTRDGEPVVQTTVCRHAELAQKYERAARYPWLPVAPDPPAPE